jgi:hypothetical protein
MVSEKLLAACFTKPDCEFALLPVQIDAALEWVAALRAQDLTWRDARSQIEAFLERQRAERTHVKRQVSRARELVRPWLL